MQTRVRTFKEAIAHPKGGGEVESTINRKTTRKKLRPYNPPTHNMTDNENDEIMLNYDHLYRTGRVAELCFRAGLSDPPPPQQQQRLSSRLATKLSQRLNAEAEVIAAKKIEEFMKYYTFLLRFHLKKEIPSKKRKKKKKNRRKEVYFKACDSAWKEDK